MIDWDSLVVGPMMSVFGEPVLYRPVGGSTFTINGVFDEVYLAQMPIEGLLGSEIANTQSALGVQISAFPANWQPAQDDVLTIVRTGQTYQVNKVEADGKGAATLLLNVINPAVPLSC